MVKRIISLTFLGTAHHRATHFTELTRSHEQIKAYSETDAGAEVAARLFDGIGFRGTADHPMPGTYICKFKSTTADGEKNAIAADDVQKVLYKFNNWLCLREHRYKVSGEGSDSLLLEVAQYIQHIIDQNGGTLPETINLQGFSRGADLCVRAANLLFLIAPEIKVNLFLIDPVPGPARDNDWDSFTIPPNVQNFQATYMLNEHFPFYAPQDPRKFIFQSNQTRRDIKMLAGVHGASIVITSRENLRIESSYHLGRDALLRFNQDNGSLSKDATLSYQYNRKSELSFEVTTLKPPVERLSGQKRFELYCQNLSDFKEAGERMVAQRFYYHRSVLENRSELVRAPDLFMDEEHRALFKLCYPIVFNWFFEGNITDKNAPQCSKREVLTQLNQITPGFYLQLFAAHFSLSIHPETGLVESLPEPFGFKCAERSRFNQKLVGDELSYFEHALTKIVNYYEMHGKASEKRKKGNQDQLMKIKRALVAIQAMDSEVAIKHLKKTIDEIKASNDSGYIAKEVSKIAEVSVDYFNEINELFMWAINDLEIGDTQKQLVKTYQQQIKSIYQDKTYNSWGKRDQIRNCLIFMHAELDILAADSHSETLYEPHERKGFNLFNALIKQNGSGVKKSDARQLSEKLSHLSEARYTETNLVDKIIYNLQAYQYRMYFWLYFVSFFSCLAPEQLDSVKIANELEVKLLALKEHHAGNNLLAINRTLRASQTCLNIVSEHKPLSHVLPSLNKIMVKAIQDTTVKLSVMYEPPQEVGQKFMPSAKKF